MLPVNREFHYVGLLTLNRSRLLNKDVQPSDDETNWLFLNTGTHQYGFIYKIQEPSKANYGEPFYADLAFLWIEAVRELVQYNRIYEALRGPEIIGTIELISAIPV